MTLVMAQVNLDHDGAADIAWSAVLEQFEVGMAEQCWRHRPARRAPAVGPVGHNPRAAAAVGATGAVPWRFG
jgi:hypothetical protein